MIGDIIKFGVDLAVGSYENQVKENAIKGQINYLKEANRFNKTLLNNKKKADEANAATSRAISYKKGFQALAKQTVKRYEGDREPSLINIGEDIQNLTNSFSAQLASDATRSADFDNQMLVKDMELQQNIMALQAGMPTGADLLKPAAKLLGQGTANFFEKIGDSGFSSAFENTFVPEWMKGS